MRTGSKRSHGWILAALFLLALIPRLYHVNSRFLTDADHNTSNWATYSKNLLERGWVPSRFGLVTNAYAPDGSAPRYFSHHPATLGLLTSLVFLVFGVSEAAARFPAILASAATAPALYLLFRRILGPPWALLSAAIFATAPWPVYFGQMLNPEPFVALLAILSLLAWARFEESAEPRWWRLSLGILAAASLTDWPGSYLAPALAAASF
ncbi:MAG TPA: glycosyltransferase family 39 protein, partial [Candidatus Saccharimonadales bacterium]|nr:glycosyltransferase family 39 protein [Candidatus Saccharimonadales bacterium]